MKAVFVFVCTCTLQSIRVYMYVRMHRQSYTTIHTGIHVCAYAPPIIHDNAYGYTCMCVRTVNHTRQCIRVYMYVHMHRQATVRQVTLYITTCTYSKLASFPGLPRRKYEIKVWEWERPATLNCITVTCPTCRTHVLLYHRTCPTLP